ncbi:MAG: class I SAM-dependent methyltransferase [Halioglobus sp.]|nr:class I SAM-dependent methyltransferase [Halioglobus sp.]
MTNSTEEFAGRVVTDMAAVMSGVMTNIGHKLGLYRAMAGQGSVTSDSVARSTGTDERYVREWLNNQVAGGYVVYEAESGTYELPAHHEPVLVDEDSPVFLVPALEVAASLWLDEQKLLDVFRSGQGISWGEHHHRLFCGSESLFRPGYKSFLATEWLDNLQGVRQKLESGAKVADIGCGHGASTITLARAFPDSEFFGYDLHAESIAVARQRARDEPGEQRISFTQCDANSVPQLGFDLICFMDCLHDMGDPVGAARRAREAMNEDGTLLLVEPLARDCVSDNINPVSRLYYAASTAVCTPCSRSQDVGLALGAQAGPQRLTEILNEAGFTRVRVATSTGFNLVMEAKI